MFKKINNYFFGEEDIEVASAVWFYGFLVVTVAFVVLCVGTMLAN